MALFGVEVDDLEEWASETVGPEIFEVYPENEKACLVFLSMSTQWVWTGGMESRRAGLNHAVLPLHMRKLGVSPDHRFSVMEDVQAMECSALATWNEMASA